MSIFGMLKTSGVATDDRPAGTEDHAALIARAEAAEAALARISEICLQAAKGDLEARIVGIDPADPSRSVLDNINRLLDLTDAYVRESRGALGAASKGAFHRRFLERGMRGTFALGAGDINRTIAEMEALERKTKDDRERLAGTFEAHILASIASVGDAARSVERTALELEAQARATIERAVSGSAAAEEASANANAVAAGAEELTAAISEIQRQSGNSAKSVNRVSDGLENARDSVENLVKAASSVDRVVSFIREIAEQTNLLALNATIEAARAGDAGRGFAVVANEVKALANQSAKATEEIAREIESMHDATRRTREAIVEIDRQSGAMREIVEAIMAAVEEQSAATAEISHNIQQAAAGATDVSEVIVDIRTAAHRSGEMAASVLDAARAMMSEADTVSNETRQFLSEVRGR